MEKVTEEKNKMGLKQLVLALMVVSLFIPMVQKQFRLVNEKPLKGFFDIAAFPEFTLQSWNAGAYQPQMEKAINENAGFHDWLVKLQCQINYSIFNISKFQTVIVGKDGYLYDKAYIDGYTGKDFIGKERIALQVEKAEVVARELKKKNITLLFALAPGKASYFPEHIPDALKQQQPAADSTNYQCYARLLQLSELNYIDLRSYFTSQKSKSKYPVYSQTGVHWGQYACFVAIDTIAKRLEELNHTRLNKPSINSIELRDTLIRTDNDEGDLMNVFSELPHYKMGYLTYRYHRDTNQTKPNLLAISDSYFSNMVATGCIDSLFANWSYWNYNKGVSSDKTDKTFSFKKEIEKRNAILIIATDASLAAFPFGFIDEAYEQYAPHDSKYVKLKEKEFRILITETMHAIPKNKEWKNQLIKSAEQKGISPLDEFIGAAVWCYNERERLIKEKITN